MSNRDAVNLLMRQARAMAALPRVLAEAYANGGPGVGKGIVADRFAGMGNRRFKQLSLEYATEKARGLQTQKAEQRSVYGKASAPVKGVVKKNGKAAVAGMMPILVLSGRLRESVAARRHSIVVSGDTGTITFANLPDYAAYHQTGAGDLPQRSPVNPNRADLVRVKEAGLRFIKAAMASATSGAPTAFGGAAPRIV